MARGRLDPCGFVIGNVQRRLSCTIRLMNGSHGTVGQTHWGALVVAALALVLVVVPFVYAASLGGEEQVFAGFLFNPLDGNTYLAKMYQGWWGEWRFTLPYTPDQGEGAYLFLHYLALGHLARLLRLDLVVAYHLARILASVFMLWALHRLYKRIFAGRSGAGAAFAFAALGSGLGWVALAFGAFTSDFWVAEAYPFLSAYANFHFPLGLGLLALLLTPEEGRGLWQYALISLLLSVVAPFGAALAMFVCAALAVWDGIGSGEIQGIARQAYFRRGAGIALGGGPMLLYSVMAVETEPLLAGWSSQNVTAAPAPWDLLVSLSPLIWAGLWGAVTGLRAKDGNTRLLVAWGLATLVLTYFPWALQRRFLLGATIPWAGLAGLALGRAGKRQLVLAALLLTLALPTNLVLLLAGAQGAQKLDPFLYLSRSEVEVYQWIEVNSPPEARILASPESGLFIPARTGRRVYYGHPFETVNASEAQRSVEAFYRGETLAEGDPYLADYDYILWGPREKRFGGRLPPEEATPVITRGDVTLYARRK